MTFFSQTSWNGFASGCVLSHTRPDAHTPKVGFEKSQKFARMSFCTSYNAPALASQFLDFFASSKSKIYFYGVYLISMKINPINYLKINQNSNINFKSKIKENIKFSNFHDSFESNLDNVFSVKVKRLGSVECDYKVPIYLNKAISFLANSSDTIIQRALLYKMHTIDELEGMILDISSDDFLRNIKIKKLLDLGAFALVFETEDGKILKLTKGNHYPNGRKPDFFDLPIKKQGKCCRTYYYLEDKITNDNITQDELKMFVKKIEEKGYIMKDYLDNIFSDCVNPKIRVEQFGKTRDGILYLVDPGCVLAPREQSFIGKFLSKIFSKIKK